MSLLDDLARGAATQLGAKVGGNLAQAALGLLNDPKIGGASGLIKLFENKGLGDVVKSWVGTGSNLPISVDQIQKVLGSAKLSELAASSGSSPDAVSSGLAQLLPQMIDKLSPDGKMPAQNALPDALAQLASSFLKR